MGGGRRGGNEATRKERVKVGDDKKRRKTGQVETKRGEKTSAGIWGQGGMERWGGLRRSCYGENCPNAKAAEETVEKRSFRSGR